MADKDYFVHIVYNNHPVGARVSREKISQLLRLVDFVSREKVRFECVYEASTFLPELQILVPGEEVRGYFYPHLMRDKDCQGQVRLALWEVRKAQQAEKGK